MRGVVIAFVLAAMVAVLGPVISYRSDVVQVRAMLKERIAQLARVDAEALSGQVELMQAELGLLSQRAQLGPSKDERMQPLLEDFTRSAMFRTGLLLVDASGKAVWSEPSTLLSRAPDFGHEPWFQTLLSRAEPTAEVVESDTHQILVASPVVREGKLRGAVVGLVDASSGSLPGARPVDEHTTVLVMDPGGDLLLPNPPAWARTPQFREKLLALVAGGRAAGMELGGEPRIAAASNVSRTPLTLAIVADEEPLVAPMRERFLLQLILVASVQTAAVILLSLFLRQTYRRTLEAERRSVETEKLAALGAAASLIAHEVKNSLNGLNAATALLSPRNAEDALPLRTLKGQIDRLKHLASSLLHFGKPTAAQRVEMDLGVLVREAVEGLSVLPEAGEVALQVSAPAVTAPCDPLLLATALDNLVRNAIEAAVAAKDLGRAPSPSVSVALRTEAGHALIEVEDNAGGPPENFVLFRPFVTSKSKGIGLGLSMARRAMEAQGGSLDFVRTDAGSRFTLQLPLS